MGFATGIMSPPETFAMVTPPVIVPPARGSAAFATVLTDAIDAATEVLRDPTALVLAATVDEVPFVASLMHPPDSESMVAPPVTASPRPEEGPVTVSAVDEAPPGWVALIVVPLIVEIVAVEPSD